MRAVKQNYNGHKKWREQMTRKHVLENMYTCVQGKLLVMTFGVCVVLPGNPPCNFPPGAAGMANKTINKHANKPTNLCAM
jgi:hypothetical protein